MNVGELIQTADWKTEKHVPVIECPDAVKVDEMFDVKVTIGKEIAHPNTTEHHIRWIHVFFKPEGDKFAYQVAAVDFSAHGESVEGPNTGPLHTHHGVTITMQTTKPGILFANSSCNIHGFWGSSKAIKVT
ncbi:MAG: class II SORL domain-containing protein [Syntrophobacterales bacterium]|jgi:superoxide reductase